MTTHPISSIKVLLIDDNEDQFELIKAMLSNDSICGFDVEWCSTFEDGVRRLVDADYDVALVDYRLDSRSGLDLLRDEAVQRADVAAVMLTAEADAAVDRQAMEAGAVDYLVKLDVTPATLKRSVRYAAERRRAHMSLAESEARHRSTFEDAPIGMAQTSLDGRWMNVNQALLAMLGFSRAEMESVHFARFTHPDDVQDNAMGLERLLSGEMAVYRCEKRYRRKDGSYVSAKLSVSLHRSADGTPEYFITAVEDLTEQKKVQQELDHIFDLSPDMIGTCGFDGIFTRTNAAWMEVLGHPKAIVESTPFMNFVHPDDRAATLAALTRLTEGKRVFSFSNRYRAVDGSYRWLEWHSTTDPATQVIYAVARDQTERRLLEEQLRHAQKMEAVGRLAGGVAHDFNNLLTAIIGFSEMVSEQLPPDGQLRKDIQQVLNASHSATSLTRQLLAFSRKQVLAPTLLDVNTQVANMSSLLRRVIGEDVALTITPSADAAHISADRGQFEQIIMNLAVNARDAMPGGGSLRIKVDTVVLDEAFGAANPGAGTGPHVRITLRDTGIGMGPEVLAHLFEPFFTTKDPGKGTGLGLATVYGIVKQSGGSISVESAPAQGTAFIIHFPSVVARAEQPVQSQERPRATVNAETILVVEDQVEVRSVIRHALQKQGYRVLEAADGREALSLLKSSDARVQLLITDVVMPQMSGHELATHARAHDQGIRVLFTSGYSDDAILRPGALDGTIDLLAKPFSHDQLLTRVRAALDKCPGKKAS